MSQLLSAQKKDQGSHLVPTQIADVEDNDRSWRTLCTAGGVVALLQLACVLVTIGVVATVGAEPDTAGEYFAMMEDDRMAGLLRLDFTTIILMSLMPLTALGIYAALRRDHGAYAAMGTALVIVGVVLGLSNNSAFSMIHLGDRYAAATTAVERGQLLAAGEAIIASDMWNSTAGFLAGVFMQGAFVFISAVMLRSRGFSKGTAFSGIAANGLDLIHVFVGLFAPSLATVLLSVGGLFYLAWFPMLGRDLYRWGRAATER